MASPIILYGSYGYTGRLIIEECKAKGIDLILSGRNGEALQTQSKQTGFPFEVVDINDSTNLCKLLEKASIVIHAAGPFQFTARAMGRSMSKNKNTLHRYHRRNSCVRIYG